MNKGKIKEVILIEKGNKLFLITNYVKETTINVLDKTNDLDATNQVCLLLGNNPYKLNQVKFLKWEELNKEQKDYYINLEKKAEQDKINNLKKEENFFLLTSIIFSMVIVITFLYGIYLITNLHTTIDTFVGIVATLVIPSVVATGTYLHANKFKEASRELNKITINKFKNNLINQLTK